MKQYVQGTILHILISKKMKNQVTVKHKEKYHKINNNHCQHQQNDC